VLERERYDGADVNHILRASGRSLDWRRVLRRFDRYWEVLLSHLMLFCFSYPAVRSAVPQWVMKELLSRASDSLREGDWTRRICRGNLISRVNYAVDLADWGYDNGRAWDERERARELHGGQGSELQGARSGGR
jgi:hypothetical protein